MRASAKTCVCILLAVVCAAPQTSGRPAPQIVDKADQIFDAARQTVTDAVGTAQGAVNTAIDAAKNAVIGNIDTVQDAAKLGVQTGQGVIELAETYVLRMLNGVGKRKK